MPLDGITAMTSAEKEVVLDITLDKVTKFTKQNLATYDRLRVKEAYPRIFGTQAPPYLKYVKPMLVNVSDIEVDNVLFEQTVRANINPKVNDLKDDIRYNGFNLAELGVFLVRLGNGKFRILEGRTRAKLLREEFRITNVIADVFDIADEANQIRFATYMNAQKKPFGEASYEDIRNVIMWLINNGAIAKQPDTSDGRATLRDAITCELNFISGGKLKPAQFDLIIHDAVDQALGYKSVASFPGGAKVEEHLEKLLGKERIKKDLENGIKYVLVAIFDEKMYHRMVAEVGKAPDSIKEIRFVMYMGVPSASDPEGSWLKHGAGFKKRFDIFEEKISKIRFNSSKPVSDRVKIWGLIPQVRSLDSKYPMNRVYVYK
tara:strand:+ start:76 stop:1200 length:1125 start_codon:yes stop_codon:yes gene_type:complete